jgi:hypothetical protein
MPLRPLRRKPRLIAPLALLFALPVHALMAAPGAVTPAIPTAAEAPVALLVDLSSGQVLHARNPDRRFMPASVTKVMTLYLAFELMEAGMLDPQQVFVVRPEVARKLQGATRARLIVACPRSHWRWKRRGCGVATLETQQPGTGGCTLQPGPPPKCTGLHLTSPP